MRVGVVGINHKLADLKLRELLAKVCQRRFGAGKSTHGKHNFVLLSTCNRTEVYYCSEDLATTHSYLLAILRQEVEEDFDQKLYSYFGHDCFLHLCRVTAGLDSAIIAETEIQGQVKSAYENVLQYHSLPYELHFLFQKSMSIAKKVRSELPLKPGLPDIEHAILNAGIHLFQGSKEVSILFVGASEINQKILNFLKTKNWNNISICNRSSGNAKVIAEKYSVAFLEWSELAKWYYYDWIIFGTKAPDHVITKSDLPNERLSQKLIIDLSVPRNVEPGLGRDPRIVLLNIDQINRGLKIRKKTIHRTLIKAEELVIQSTGQHIKIFQEREKNRLQIFAVSA
jgi:glutamyl-tRNA reductase